MFILNPPSKGKARTKTIRMFGRKYKGKSISRKLAVRRIGRRRLLRMRLARNPKTGRFLKKVRRRIVRRHRDNPVFRRKSMAVRTRRRKAGRRRYRRNAWFRQSRDHAVAAKLGWAYQTRRRKKGGSPRRYIVRRIGRRGLLHFRSKHKPSKRRRSYRRMINFHVPMFGRRYKLVANKRRRKSSRRRKYMDNARRTRRRRHVARGAGGRFVSNRKRSRRRYRKNWFVYNDNAPKRRRRRYAKNWFVYDDNRSKRRRRRSYRRNTGRRYMKNDVVADVLDTVKSVFDVEFITGTALPVVGGFFLTRLLSGFVGGAVLGAGYTGIARTVGNFVASGLAGAVVGAVMKDPQLAGNVLLGGVVNALAGVLRDVANEIDIVKATPALSSAFGLSGLGVHDDVRSAVEREVMKELGVSDYLTAEQLGRSERIGDFLTSEQLGRAERIGGLSQYPAETSGPAYLAQYPEETSGGAMADFADVASFGG
jgi:hypothetical protein